LPKFDYKKYLYNLKINCMKWVYAKDFW
jgi:hypothetical protein